MVQVLKQCDGDFSRDNLMKQAANLSNLALPTLLPGVTVSTSPTNFHPIRTMRLQRWNGARVGAVRRRHRGLGRLMADLVLVESGAGTRTLTHNRPDKLNVFDDALHAALAAALDAMPMRMRPAARSCSPAPAGASAPARTSPARWAPTSATFWSARSTR